MKYADNGSTYSIQSCHKRRHTGQYKVTRHLHRSHQTGQKSAVGWANPWKAEATEKADSMHTNDQLIEEQTKDIKARPAPHRQAGQTPSHENSSYVIVNSSISIVPGPLLQKESSTYRKYCLQRLLTQCWSARMLSTSKFGQPCLAAFSNPSLYDQRHNSTARPP